MKAIVQRLTGHNLKELSHGSFSRVFRSLNDPSVIFIVCAYLLPDKEILAQIDNPHVPTMQQVDSFEYREKDYAIWQTEYSDTLKNAHGSAYDQAIRLNSTWEAFTENKFIYSRSADSMNYAIVEDFICYLESNHIVDQSIINALDRIYTWATAHSSNFWFEFQLHNLGISKDGTLLLRDIIFFPSHEKYAL